MSKSYPEAYLAHYGVLGMKWGVRKERKRAAKSARLHAKADAAKAKIGDKYDKYANSTWTRGFKANSLRTATQNYIAKQGRASSYDLRKMGTKDRSGRMQREADAAKYLSGLRAANSNGLVSTAIFKKAMKNSPGKAAYEKIYTKTLEDVISERKRGKAAVDSALADLNLAEYKSALYSGSNQASRQAASLGMTGGTNPLMFG